jgi:hypothetical protein
MQLVIAKHALERDSHSSLLTYFRGTGIDLECIPLELHQTHSSFPYFELAVFERSLPKALAFEP